MVASLAACYGTRTPGGTPPPGSGALADGLQEGPWTHWYPDGQVESRGRYERDDRSGPWTHWYPDGTLRMRGAYLGGRQEGLWEFWHADGALQCRGEYRAGREQGEWTFWTADGVLDQRGVFDAGRRTLEWQSFDRTGQESARGSYFEDQPVGRWTRSAGAEVVEYPLPEGVEQVLEYWPAGGVRREGFLRQGRPVGLWVTRHPNGALRALGRFEDGELNGELSVFDDAGAFVARGPVRGPTLFGTWSLGGATPSTLQVVARPRAPWDRRWSEPEFSRSNPPLDVAARLLDELAGPREPLPRAIVALTPVGEASEPPTPRPAAPTDPGHFTARERDELALLRRYYRDGWLPRRHRAGARYGAAADAPRLGEGEPLLAEAATGSPLPVTKFPQADGQPFDLDRLQGQKVLVVVLRGFTTQVCVYCFAQTAELAPCVPRFAAEDCEVVVLYPGSGSHLAAFQEACREEFGDTPPPYHMVHDPELSLARALGLQADLVRPASFVLDRTGVVRHAYIAESCENIADRPSVEDLLRWVRATP